MMPRTLRGQVVAGVLGAWLLMVALLALVVSPRVQSRLVTAEENRAAQVAEGIAGAVEVNLRVALDELDSVARLGVIRGMDPPVLDVALASLQSSSPLLLHLTVLDTSGIILSRPILPEHVGESRADRPYFAAVLSGARRFVGEPRMSSMGQVSLNVATPIEDPEGNRQGILMGAFGVADRNPLLYQPVVQPTAPPGWRVFLLSRQGFLMADSEAEIVNELGLEGVDFTRHPSFRAPIGEVVRYQESDGERVAVAASVSGIGWRVVTEIPEPLLTAGVDAAMGDIFLAAGLSALLLLAMGAWLSWLVTRRITPLARALQRHNVVTSEELLPESGNDEIGQAIRAFNGLVRDRKRLHEEVLEKDQSLLQAGKMEALGRLAGGVAHDFNNLLTVIMGYTQLVKPKGPEGAKGLATISSAAEQARTLSLSLLSFSRQRESTAEPVELNTVVEAAEVLLRPLIGRHVELSVHPAPERVIVVGDRYRLQQIVVNLAVNARDAMPDGGSLRIGVKTIPPPRGSHGSTQALIFVEDTGEGIPPEEVGLIFEPFFTTKPPGEGTGLGLSMARTVMEGLGGRVEVDSEVGVGTRFSLVFPRMLAPDEEPVEMGSSGTEEFSGRVLLVEDMDEVRAVTQGLLEAAGHEVVAAASGDAALDLLLRGLEVDLVLSDISMGGMSGVDLALLVAQRYPEVAVVLMSAEVQPVTAELTRIREDVEFIPKPFTFESLRDRVSEVLRRNRTRVRQLGRD